MKEKNKKLLIITGALLLVVGSTLAYFVATVLLGGEGAKIKASTASINGATIKVRGTLEFDTTDLEMYPGHKTISGIELTATGDGEFIPYNLVWQGINTLNTPLEFTVYKSEVEKDIDVTCNKTTKVEAGAQILYEECNTANIDTLGSPIYNGTINKNQDKVTLSSAEFITATSTGNKVYYYVVLEYPNLNEEQNEDIGGRFKGEVTVEESNSKADLNIIAAYIKQEDGTYKETQDIPQSGYQLNSEKSTCSNGATPKWQNKGLFVSSLTKSGTSCYLYFDKKATASETILANVTPKTTIPDFTKVATTDEGVYAVEDGMYGGTSYYWRGAVTNNYIKFANKCWRIIRINGDGSIRLIYAGTTCHANGETTTDSIAVANQNYSSSTKRSELVGYTYTMNSQRPVLNKDINGLTVGGTASNLKIQIDNWFTNNIIGVDAEKVAVGKFCNDRNVESGYTWSSTPSSTFYYAGAIRIGVKSAANVVPTLACSDGDTYELNAGTITTDELIMAGSKFGGENSTYYLYNGHCCWTMTPHSFFPAQSSPAYMHIMLSNGSVWTNSVTVGTWNGDSTGGIRPAINLHSDITFSSGDGTQNSPYVIDD